MAFGLAFLLWLVVPIISMWGILDAALAPDSAWERIDQNKVAWVLVQFVPLVGAIAYFLAVRPALRDRSGSAV